MSATMKKHQTTFTLDEIAELLGVDPWEKIEDRNPDAWGFYYVQAMKDAREEGLSDEEAEEKALAAESEARDESYRNWSNAVERAADEILGQHKLQIRQMKTKSYLFKLEPTETWEEAARCIVDTINGVGYFYFASVKEFRDSIPCTTRQAVLDHLHWMKRRPEVYDTASADRLMGDWDR